MTTAPAISVTDQDTAPSEKPVLSVFDDGLNELRKRWGWILAIGVCLILAGMGVIAAPFLSSLVIESFIGWSLAIGGIAVIIAAFFARSWSGFFGRLGSGLLNVTVGGLLLFNPLAGLVSLTAMVAAYLSADGALRIAVSLQCREQTSGWGWLLANGLLSLLCGSLVAIQLPESSLVVIGALVGVNLIFNGWSHVLLALEVRRVPTS